MSDLLTLLLNLYKLDIIDADQVKIELYKAGYMQGPIEVNKINDIDLKRLETKNFTVKIKR